MIKNKFLWLSLLILFIALFIPLQSKNNGPSYDKLAHFLLFAFVSINVVFYFSKNTKKLGRVFGLVSMLPILTEVIQIYIPGRNYDVYDILADYIGLVMGIFIFVILKKQFIAIYKLFGDKYIPNPGEIKFL